MKPIVAKSLTHAAGIGLGIILAALIGNSISTGTSSSEKTSAPAVSSSRPERPDRPDRPASRPPMKKSGIRATADPRFRSRDYQAAWDAIAFRDVTTAERVALQKQVLMEWAEIDLEGALKATLASSWDGDRNADAGLRGLLSVFNEQFRKNPIAAWDLINSGKLGLGSSIIKIQWAYAAAAENPTLVLSTVPDLPSNGRGSVLTTLAHAASRDPAKREEFLRKFMEFPDGDEFTNMVTQVLNIFGTSTDPDQVRQKLTSATSPQQVSFLMHELGISLKTADLETKKSEWAKLPPELQGRAARAIVLHSDATKNTTELFDLLLQTNELDFAKTQAWRFSRYAQATGNPAELAQWAVTKLPESPQTQEILHRAVAPYIASDFEGSRAWIQTLPKNDWRRDRALAEYSQQSLWKQNNTELSTWALDSIADPQLKADATKWRGEWARQTGRGQ